MEQIQLYNSDCLDTMKTIDDNCIDLILTDPPYGVNYKNDFFDDSEDTIIKQMPSWFNEWYRVLKEDSYLVVFTGVKTLHHWINSGIESGFNYKNIIATRSFNNGSKKAKNNFGFQFQPIILFSKGKGKAFNNVDFIPTSKEWLNDKRNKNPNPFTYEYPNFIKTDWAFATSKSRAKDTHPNSKNIDLLKFFINVLTNENDIVMDTFMGSGATGIASKETNRNFVGMELDTNYFDIACKHIYNKK